MGAGDTAGVERRLGDLAGRLPFDVYVALVDTPPSIAAKTHTETSEYLVRALHTRMNRPGLYLVATSHGILEQRAWDIALDDTTQSLQSADNQRRLYARLDELEREREAAYPAVSAEIAMRTADALVSGSGDTSGATLSDGEIDEIARLPYAGLSKRDLGTETESNVGFLWMAGTTAAVLTLLAGVQTLRRAWPAWRKPAAKPAHEPEPSATRIDDVRSMAGGELTRLADELAAAPADVPHPEHTRQAVAARDAAEYVLSSDDICDVAGALVLARSGRRDVERASATEPGEPYRCCFFNPLHRHATEHASWEFGDAELPIPVCERCKHATDNGEEVDLLRAPLRLGDRPYYERDDVWARTGFGCLVDDLGTAVLEARR